MSARAGPEEPDPNTDREDRAHDRERVGKRGRDDADRVSLHRRESGLQGGRHPAGDVAGSRFREYCHWCK